MHVIFSSHFMGGWIAHTLTRPIIYVTLHIDPKNKIHPKVQLWHERLELVSCSYGNTFLMSLSALQPQKEKKKGRMKNKQREIPSPSYAEPKHIF
jgi:hypothetical protein